jgi:hypothetical protein
VFTNRGEPCALRAYPGVDGIGADGRPLVHAKRTMRGYLGGAVSPETVPLGHGQIASALVEGLNGPVAGSPPCPKYVAYLVTPPNETHSVRLPSAYSMCNLEVHPVVPGRDGTVPLPGDVALPRCTSSQLAVNVGRV